MEMMESPIADGGILNSIISAKNGIPDGSKEAEHPFESEQGIVEVVVDESSSLQGSKADAFVPFDIKDTEDNEKQEVSSRAEIRTLQAVDFVNCVNDTDATNTSKSCAEACKEQGMNCCIGEGSYIFFPHFGYIYYPACEGFTGKVYANSCIGRDACKDASIPTVKNGCNNVSSCADVGLRGFVGEIVDSCIGENACKDLGREGYAGNLKNSCIGSRSCQDVGTVGVVGEIVDSCIGSFACLELGSGGVVGEIVDSCIGSWACAGLESAGDLTDACNGKSACEGMDSHADMTRSCNALYACAFQGVIASSMYDCCNDEYECFYASSVPTTCTKVRDSPK
jgi:hypothetical protein